MSLGYAEKLSYKEDVGEVGMKEYFSSPRILEEKIEELALMIRKSKHLVAFTGAGISTACGIPDFRGPKGIWTLQREGRALPQASLPFHRAMPSMTHMALVELEKAGILKFLISQNVDGLHLRSGIPRNKLAELHGNSFMEACPSCGLEYFRDFEVGSVGLKETSRLCSDIKCAAKLRDTVLDWECSEQVCFDELPSKEMNSAEKHCNMADVVLCLGTSLQITPACDLPMRCLRRRGKIVLVNLQKTPKDKHATLIIRGLVDEVVAGVMKSLNLQIAPFIRVDYLKVIFTKRLSIDKKFVNWTLEVASVHGQKAPLPFIKTVEISFLDEETYKDATLYEQPFQLKRRTERSRTFSMLLKLHLADGCGCLSTEINIAFDPQISSSSYDPDRNMIIQGLKDTTIQESRCGTHTVIEKKADLNSKSETTDYAIVTNMVSYNMDSKDTANQAIENGDLKKRKESLNSTARSQKRSKGYKQKPAPSQK